MKYISTRGDKEFKTSTEAIIQGISGDKGLFVPDNIPKLPFRPGEMTEANYTEVAYSIIKSFFPEYSEEELRHCVNSAYDKKFRKAEIVPLVKGGDAFFLELYHGKTSAFKDMALSILPYLLTTAVKKEGVNKKICILTATSGDTGKAALEGFSDVEGTEIFVFYPNKGVSKVQERQMVTQEGKNTHVFSIEGNFDNAQTGVKRIFNDIDLGEKLNKAGCKLSSANSINIGRLVPQVAYYVFAYLQLIKRGDIKEGDEINVVVPTGNFGNILAAYYSREMGIPVHKFICASNENKVLTDFINTGVYSIKRDFYLTNSPSMDILISSNLERLLYYLSGGNSGEVRTLMEKLESEKEYEVGDKIKEGLKDFYGGFATVEETIKTIGKMYGKHDYLIDTHTAVAYKVYEDYRRETSDERATVIASTASPYKFAADVAKAIGIGDEEEEFKYLSMIEEVTGVSVPEPLKGLEHRKVIHKNNIPAEDMGKIVMNVLMGN